MRLRVAVWAAWVMLLVLLASAAQAAPAAAMRAENNEPGLRGEWRPAGAAPSQARDFDPAQLTSFGRPSGGVWVLLHPRDGAWPAGEWVLSVESPGFQRLTLHAPGRPALRGQLLASDPARLAYGRVAFELASMPADGAPIRLHVDAAGVVPGATSFVLRRADAQVRVEARWLAFATACLATMLVTAIIALAFGLRLRDAAFGYYAAYVAAYALIQATQTGYLAHPLQWDALAASLPAWGRAVTTASVVTAVLFLDRFAFLRERMPRMRRVLQAYCAALLVLAALGYVPGWEAPVRALVNPALILGGPLVLGTALAAAWRGSRWALLFLVGWVPLLAVTVVGSLQLYGVAPGWTWTDDAALLAGAFEAVVLSLGLAERAATVRRQRDDARQLARTDPLTGVLNRRALREQLQRLAGEGGGLSVCYLDIDHFKQVNDHLGHEGGDRVLEVFADVLRAAVGSRDVLGRYGGEEFIAGLAGAGPAEALAIAARIRAGLGTHRALPPGAPVTVSMGVATHRPGESLDELLRRADAALYAAKRSGRDRVVAADDAMPGRPLDAAETA